MDIVCLPVPCTKHRFSGGGKTWEDFKREIIKPYDLPRKVISPYIKVPSKRLRPCIDSCE